MLAAPARSLLTLAYTVVSLNTPLPRRSGRQPNILRELADAYRSAAIEAEERPDEQVRQENVDERTARSLGIDIELAEFVRRVFEETDLTAAKIFDEPISHFRRLSLKAVA